MAIAAVLPKNEHSERNLIFTVLSVTILSTVAMIAYPIITAALDLDDIAAGVFLGWNDPRRGAGRWRRISVSNETGETATLVKLIRVTMLAPVVLVFALVIRAFAEDADAGDKRPPLMPFFVVMFLVLAGINSLGLIPAFAQSFWRICRNGRFSFRSQRSYENIAQDHIRCRRAGHRSDRGPDDIYRRLHPLWHHPFRQLT